MTCGRRFLAICLAVTVLLSPAWLWAAGESSTAPAATAPVRARVTLAVLSEPKPSPMVAALVEELTRRLAAGETVTLLDREHLGTILAEHQMSLAEVVREPVRQGKMLGADYLLHVTSQGESFAPAYGLLCLEVASGNVIFETMLSEKDAQNAAKEDGEVGQAARQLTAGIAASEAVRSRPSAVVADSVNKSSSHRLDSLEGSLRGLLEDLLAARGYRVLRRSHAGLLAGETALGSSGLTRPDAAVLADVGDLVISVKFTESPSLDKPFEQTPIGLDLEVKVKNGQTTTKRLSFTLAAMKDLVPQLKEEIPVHLNHAEKDKTAADDDSERRIEAARLLVTLEDPKFNPFMATAEENRRLVEIARRVIYLDPSAKEAYYSLAFSMWILIQNTTVFDPATRERHEPKDVSWREVETAYETYLTFPRTNKDHVYLAFVRALSFSKYKYQGDELIQRNLDLLMDHCRWCHELDPKGCPMIGTGNASDPLQKLWKEHPEKMVEFDAWVNKLYGRTPAPAAPSAIVIPEVKHSWGDPEDHAKSSWDYYLNGADYEAKRYRCPAAVVESVALPLQRTDAMISTPSGLWIQGRTADGRLALCRSTANDQWEQFVAPSEQELNQDLPNNLAHSLADRGVAWLAQAGSEILYFRKYDGVYAYDLKKKSWRHIGVKEGLPAATIQAVAAGVDGQSVWVVGEGYLWHHKDGSVFLSPIRLSGGLRGFSATGDRIFCQMGLQLSSLDSAGKKLARLIEAKQLELQWPEPKYYISKFNRAEELGPGCLLARQDKVFMITGNGFQVLTPAGRPLRLWRAKTFFWFWDCGVWLEANCPLPPCGISAIVADDQKKNLVWLVSGTFITAYDSDTNLFSKPLRFTRDAGHNPYNMATLIAGERGAFAPCGDYLYQTGKTFLRAAKKQWVVDQPGEPPDAPPRVTCPDKDLAEASIALYYGDFDKVKECLKQIPESRLTKGTVNRMLGMIDGLRKAAANTSATPAEAVPARSDVQPKVEAAPQPASR